MPWNDLLKLKCNKEINHDDDIDNHNNNLSRFPWDMEIHSGNGGLDWRT